MHILKPILAAIFVASTASFVLAQDTVVTKKDVVVNSDGTYSVIEYPVGKEVTVNLVPSAAITGGKGIARVIRAADGTKVHFDISGIPATTTSYYAYAVDPSGVPTYLGPLTFKNGVSTAEFATPMNQFMLVVSPAEGLTAVSPSNVVFTSEVPTGYSVVERRVVIGPVSAVAASTVVKYDVPLLNIPSFGEDAKTVNLHFKGTDLNGLDAKAHIHRHKGEATTIRMEFDDLKKVPKTKRFVLWAYTPDGQYTRLGQIYNYKNRDEARIEAKTTLDDFGLFLTAEDTDVTVPTSRIYSVFTYTP